MVESPEGVTVLALTDAERARARGAVPPPLPRGHRGDAAGVVEEGEDPARAALRELKEETGYVAERARILGVLDLNPSWQTTRVHVALVRGARDAGERELDAGEDTRVRAVALERARDWVRSGRLRSATAVAALALLELAGDARG